MGNFHTHLAHLTPGPREPQRPGRGSGAPRTIGYAPPSYGDAFEWREGARMPPPPSYDSHRLDDDGSSRFALLGNALR